MQLRIAYIGTKTSKQAQIEAGGDNETQVVEAINLTFEFVFITTEICTLATTTSSRHKTILEQSEQLLEVSSFVPRSQTLQQERESGHLW